MYSSRSRNQNRQRSRDPLEKKMDQWLETGRQFVDGVSGNRPGQRRSNRSISSSFDNVGRWVGDKIDWFLEEEDDWMEPWQPQEKDPNINLSTQKRPMKAISLRGTKSIPPASRTKEIAHDRDSWPDDSAFRIEKWERNDNKQKDDPEIPLDSQEKSNAFQRRSLPRSSRRRKST